MSSQAAFCELMLSEDQSTDGKRIRQTKYVPTLSSDMLHEAVNYNRIVQLLKNH